MKVIWWSLAAVGVVALGACVYGMMLPASPAVQGRVSPASATCSADQVALGKAAILAQHPAGSEQVDKYQECDEKQSPSAGRAYLARMPAARVVAFYQTAVTAAGTELTYVAPSPSADVSGGSDVLLCARMPLGGADAYLDLWYPDQDSGLVDEPGVTYLVELSRDPGDWRRCPGS